MSTAPNQMKRKGDTTWMRVLEKVEVSKPTWVTPAPRPSPLFGAKDPQGSQVDPLAGERAALAQAKRDADAMAQAYRESIASLERARAAQSEEAVAGLTELAFSVGRELAMRELQNDPTPVAELIRKLAAEMTSDGRLSVRVALDDYPALMASDALSQPDTRALEIVADSKLPTGSCVVEGKKTRVDASFAQRERAVRRALELVEEPRAYDLMRSAGSEGALQ